MVLSASYTDKGGNNIKALTGNNSVSLRSNTISFTGNEKVKGFTTLKYGGNNVMVFPAGEGWFALDQIDLTGVKAVNLTVGWQATPKNGISIEARLDAPDGKLLGKGTMPVAKKGQQFGVLQVPFETVTDGKFHTIYFVYKAQEAMQAGIMSLQFNGK